MPRSVSPLYVRNHREPTPITYRGQRPTEQRRAIGEPVDPVWHERTDPLRDVMAAGHNLGAEAAHQCARRQETHQLSHANLRHWRVAPT